MSAKNVLPVSVMALTIAAFAALAQTPDKSIDQRQQALDTFKGTWRGKSICVGDHPACKNEEVVYRFVPFTAAPWQLRCLADKIVAGKRLPMGALMFQYDERTHGIRGEFKKGSMHILWLFAAEGDSLRGELDLLPAGDKGRDVRAIRVVDESTLPPAPLLKEYDE